MIMDIETILKVCGAGSYLQIGCGKNPLVHPLLKRSINAYGMDASLELVEQHNATAPGRFMHGALQNYPFAAKTFDTIIVGAELLYFAPTDLPVVLTALQQMTKRHLVLYFSQETLAAIPLHSAASNRLFWEKAFIDAGFRKHTRAMLSVPYSELENERINQFTFFECLSNEALQTYSLAWLAENRDLHMDMLREPGRRSDGHVSRYVLAATLIRPGDFVVDAACGLGYGTAVMAACSNGARFMGIDIDNTSTAYATVNFAAQNSALSYQSSDVTQLAFLPDHSVDVIVSFETIEHIVDYDLFLSEAKRILKPDGRFIGSVPNLWCDETGKDPNPYHFHVFHWNKLYEVVNNYFIVDGRWAQTAGGGYKVAQGHREMHYVPLATVYDRETEWWIISACGDPLTAKEVPYTNPFQRTQKDITPAHVDFATYYDNPWLYRVMVQLGERLIDRDVLFDFCAKVEKQARVGSADQGAALCVLSYQLFESNCINIEYLSAQLERINAFMAAYDPTNLHAYRWAVSLSYIVARLLLMIGNRDEALATFRECSNMDALRFSPLLATKTISSRLYAGMILAGNGSIAEAKEQFSLGIQDAHRVTQGDWETIVGDIRAPFAFGLPEIAEVLEIAAQCAQALHAVEKQQSVPGYFWNQINLRRFGLLEWNKHLERENEILRKQLANAPMLA